MSDFVSHLGNSTNSTCPSIAAMPFGGTEILVLACFYLFVCVCFCVTFIDVAAKQMWPSFLDPAVTARVQAIQQMFPGLAPPAAGAPKPKQAAGEPTYTHVVAQEAYIAGRTVDEDLIYILANNTAYSTVSSYCSSTVRGYAMLSSVLMVAGIVLGFVWTHNVMIDPSAGGTPGQAALLGYCLVFLTSIVMTNPDTTSVNRNANLALWSNFPLSCWGKSNPMLKLHDIGIMSFIALPLFSHIYTLYTSGSSYANYTAGWTGAVWQLLGAACFGLSSSVKGKYGITEVQGAKLMIMSEVVVVFASFLAYLQWEFFATANCAGQSTAFHSLLLGAAFAPFAFCAKRYWCAPASFPQEPSVVLMNGDQVVATSGPAPVLVFDTEVPNVPSL
jgi:hypothetical protein